MLLPFSRLRAPESVYFYTFHKCASSLFGEHLLNRISGLRHRDYATMLYRGRLREGITFAERGYAYGPLRLSASKWDDEYKRLIAPVATQEFVSDRICLFFIRDPRDILVSSYYSFGFSHPLSPVPQIREHQIREREEIQAMTLDEYALSQVEERRANFTCLHELHAACRRGVLLRYEDMVHDFDRFAADLCTYVQIKSRVLCDLERLSRPKPQIDPSQHRRSGRTGQFRAALRKETVTSLNEHLGDTLELFGYDA